MTGLVYHIIQRRLLGYQDTYLTELKGTIIKPGINLCCSISLVRAVWGLRVQAVPIDSYKQLCDDVAAAVAFCAGSEARQGQRLLFCASSLRH